MLEPTIYDLSAPGRVGVNLPECDVPEAELPTELLRDDLALPEVGEVQVVRHFVKLSQLNYSIDKGFYPLGSCTMKYNPKINEDAARLPGFAQLHPLTEIDGAQGALYLMYELQKWLGRNQRLQCCQSNAGRRRPGRVRWHFDDPQISPR